MGKQNRKTQGKKVVPKTENSTENEPAAEKEKYESIGITDKLSRIFYSWMKKKKSTFYNMRTKDYEIKGLICEGTFGKVFVAVNTKTRLTAAAKLERMDTPCPQLKIEYNIYEKLGCERPGFIKVYHYGPCDKIAYNALVMELLGPDLDDLLVSCQGTFSLKTVLMIAIQVLEIMQHIHNKNIIYRDVKPENFCIGHIYQHKEKIIHIIDFGLSKNIDLLISQMSTSEGEEMIGDYLIGTARYMSLNAHFALEQSQRDDLESVGYMFVYFLRGRLPWMGLSRSSSTIDHYRHIATMKASLEPEALAADCPGFCEYFSYVKSLECMETPNYGYLLKLMRDTLVKYGFKNDCNFDWTSIMNQKYLNKALVVDPDD